jgi:hypothetical protein
MGRLASCRLARCRSIAALRVLGGGHVFTGDVDGSSFEVRVIGTRPQTMGNCTYTFDGELAGNSVSGRLNFTTATNNNSDCAVLKACVSFLELAASPERVNAFETGVSEFYVATAMAAA